MAGLRVGFAVLRFFHERTGNIESLLNLMTGLAELGVEPSLLVPRATEQLELFHDFSVIRYSELSRFDFDIFAIERALVRACGEQRARFDLLQLGLPSPAFARVAERVRRAAQLPVIASFESAYHRAPAVAWPHAPKTLLNLLLRRALNDRAYAYFTRFEFEASVVASEYQQRELLAAGCSGDRIAVIPNATVCERFASAQPSTAHDPLFPPQKRVIAYVGHFNFIKGVTHLIEAFALLAARRSDVQLLLVGSGRGNESAAVKRGVAALGSRATLYEQTIDVPALLRRVSVLALPYVAAYGHQLFPNLVLEAFAAGVPLVSSDIPPVNEILREGETGHLARPGDPTSLAAALERALDRTPVEQAAIAARQRALCGERFDRRVVAERHLELYKRLLP